MLCLTQNVMHSMTYSQSDNSGATNFQGHGQLVRDKDDLAASVSCWILCRLVCRSRRLKPRL